jgi:hypothetical protein
VGQIAHVCAANAAEQKPRQYVRLRPDINRTGEIGVHENGLNASSNETGGITGLNGRFLTECALGLLLSLTLLLSFLLSAPIRP